MRKVTVIAMVIGLIIAATIDTFLGREWLAVIARIAAMMAMIISALIIFGHMD